MKKLQDPRLTVPGIGINSQTLKGAGRDHDQIYRLPFNLYAKRVHRGSNRRRHWRFLAQNTLKSFVAAVDLFIYVRSVRGHHHHPLL